MAQQKFDPRFPTPDFTPKPKPTPQLIERKKAKPPGFCADVAAQQARIKANKAKRADFGRNGPSGRKEVKDLMSSPEMLFVFALIFAAGNSFKGLFAAIFGIGSRSGPARRAPYRSTGGETGGGGQTVKPAAGRPTRGVKPVAGGSRSGSSVSSGFVRGETDELEPFMRGPSPMDAKASKRKRSHDQGAVLRTRAGEVFGDEMAYDHLYAVLAYKPGMPKNPRDEFGAFERLRKLHPDLGDYLDQLSPGSKQYVEFRDRLAQIGISAGGSALGADRADVASRILPEVIGKAEAWRSETLAFQSAGPTPEAGSGTVANAPSGSAPKPDETDAYTPPTPGMR